MRFVKNKLLNAIISGSLSFWIDFGIFYLFSYGILKKDIFSYISEQIQIANLTGVSYTILSLTLPFFIFSLFLIWIGMICSNYNMEDKI